MTNTPLKLNIGGGDPKSDTYVEREGYVLVDRSVGKEAYPLDYEDDSVDEILASHVLEHFPYEQVMDVLKDWVRALKPGGVLKIAVPDFAWITKQYGEQNDFNIQGFLYGGHLDENDHHKSAFDSESMKEMLALAGLTRLRKWESDVKDCASLPLSCNWMGYKPDGPIKTLPNVCAVLAAPRFGPTTHFRCLLNATEPLHIRTTIIQGCFWWMQLCEAMEECLAEGAEYILTLDYDSIFSKDDVTELYRLLQVYPEADAVCALQSHRGEDRVLVGMSKEDIATVNHLTFAGNLTQVETGHFGCTLFRADKLRDHPKPWMNPEPSEDGSWNRGSGAVHPDIDFWYRWKAAGKTLYCANHVVIGHMQELITYPSQNFSPIHQPLVDYITNGVPAEAKQ